MTDTYALIICASLFIGFFVGRFYQYQKSLGRQIFEEYPGELTGWGAAIDRDGDIVQVSVYKDNHLQWKSMKHKSELR